MRLREPLKKHEKLPDRSDGVGLNSEEKKGNDIAVVQSLNYSAYLLS